MSFTAWIKGRVIPINSVLGLREILDNLVEDAINEGSTTTAPSQDAVYQEIDSINAALALKADIQNMNPTLAPDSNLKASYWGNYGIITRESDADTVLTFNDDMKTGRTYYFKRKNTNETLTRNTTIPTPREGSSVYTTAAGEYNTIAITWDSKNGHWSTFSSGSRARVAS
jgi:hypothetical protein